MTSFTLITRDRQFRMERVETLRELLARKLISPADQVRPEHATRTLTVAEALALLDRGVPLDGGGEGGADPWRAWDTDDSVEVGDLIGHLVGDSADDDAPSAGEDEVDTELWLTQLSQRGAGPIASERDQDALPPVVAERPVDAAADDDQLPSIPASSIQPLREIPRSDGGARPAGPGGPPGRRSGAPRATVSGSHSAVSGSYGAASGSYGAASGSYGAASGSYGAATGSTSTASGSHQVASGGSDAVPGSGVAGRPRPSSFVEYVQQKRAAASGMELHEDPTPIIVSGDRRRGPVGFWPAVAAVMGLMVAMISYGVIRSGAERTYPSESEVRAHLRDNPGGLEALAEDDPLAADTAAIPVPLSETEAFRESRLRSSIPVPMRKFNNVESFKDALFIDLANSAVLVNEIRVEALVVAPMPDVGRQRPEEVNLELWLLCANDEAGMDAALKSALVIGHYGAVAHVRVQELVMHLVDDGEVWASYLTRGTAAMSFWEGKTDLLAFQRSMDRVTDGDYIEPTAFP